MLSDIDIVRELGKNIFIYPFKSDNLKGASINLSASNMAWSISTKRSIVQNNKITIEKHDTALIYTNEIVAITKKMAGTFHSRVNDVSNGCGHIGTTLNPGWFGRLLIAVTNHTEEPININVDDPFVTLIFYYLNSKSSNDEDDNVKSRTDVLRKHNIALSDEENSILSDRDISTRKVLKQVINKNKVYDEIKGTKKAALSIKLILAIIFLIITIVVSIVCSKYNIQILNTTTTIILTFLITYILTSVFKNKE